MLSQVHSFHPQCSDQYHYVDCSKVAVSDVLCFSLRGGGNVTELPQEKLFGKFHIFHSHCQHACLSGMLLGEVDPVFKFCHSP